MHIPATLERTDLVTVAQRCAEETERFFSRLGHDPRYCFELFRRAMADRLERAWEYLYLQYRPLVIGWVKRNPCYPATGEEAAYFANRAFERMWGAIPAERFGRFADLKSLLRYLQMCVHSVVVDHARRQEQEALEADADRLVRAGAAVSPSARQQALDRLKREDFWREIQSRLNSDQERLVVRGCFIEGLTPRALYERHRGTFASVTEIYRTKENVLARLRRDEGLRDLFA